MPEITPVQATTIQCSSLTQDDIARMPKSSVSLMTKVSADTFESDNNESHTLRNTIIGLIIAAAAIVGLKHCSFMKVEANDAGFMAKYVKKPVTKLGEWIEWPFVKVANMVKGDKS